MNTGKTLPTTLSGWLTIFALLALITAAAGAYVVVSHASLTRFWWWLGVGWAGTVGLFLDWYFTGRKKHQR